MQNLIDGDQLCDYLHRLLDFSKRHLLAEQSKSYKTCLYGPDGKCEGQILRSKERSSEKVRNTNVIPVQFAVITGKELHKQAFYEEVLLPTITKAHQLATRRILRTDIYTFSDLQGHGRTKECRNTTSFMVQPEEYVFHQSSLVSLLTGGIALSVREICKSFYRKYHIPKKDVSWALWIIDNFEDLSFIHERDSHELRKAIDMIEDKIKDMICKNPILPLCTCLVASEVPMNATHLGFDSSPVFDFTRKRTLQLKMNMLTAKIDILFQRGIVREMRKVSTSLSARDYMPNSQYENVKLYCEFRIRKMLSLYHASQVGMAHSPLEELFDTKTGILLYAPPGCGKSHLIYDLAGTFHSKCVFFTVFTPLLLSAFLGESESFIRALFSFLRSKKPCVYIMEGFHCIGRKRMENNSQILYSLLCELDGIGSNNTYMLGIASTHQPLERLDAAATRPGRLGALLNLSD